MKDKFKTGKKTKKQNHQNQNFLTQQVMKLATVKADSNSKFKKALGNSWTLRKWIIKGLARDTLSDVSNQVMADDGTLEREWFIESDLTYYSLSMTYSIATVRD